MMSHSTANRPHIHDIGALPIGDIVNLPPEHLALLQEDAGASLEAARRIKDRIDGAIAQRYAGRAQALRREAGKDTGAVRFADDGVSVEADLPKRVDWDQAQLAAVVERIRAAGDDPGQYVEIAFKVPERKYNAWPETVRTVFAPARTVRTGKPSFRLLLGEEVSS